MSATKNETIKTHSHLVRSFIATLKIDVLGEYDIRFRAAQIAAIEPTLAAMEPGFHVRLYEAVCDAKFPDPTLVDFRHRLQRTIAPAQGIPMKTARPAK